MQLCSERLGKHRRGRGGLSRELRRTPLLVEHRGVSASWSAVGRGFQNASLPSWRECGRASSPWSSSPWFLPNGQPLPSGSAGSFRTRSSGGSGLGRTGRWPSVLSPSNLAAVCLGWQFGFLLSVGAMAVLKALSVLAYL